MQIELGKRLYNDWKVMKMDAHEEIRKLGKENIKIDELKKGFIEERMSQVADDGENEECFYGAMDEVGTAYWQE